MIVSLSSGASAAFAALAALALPAAALQGPDTGNSGLENRITPEVRVVQSAAPSVVYIETNVPGLGYDWLGRSRRVESMSSGSGVLIQDEGYIVTNYHVVRNASRITVRFDPSYDDKPYEAKLLSFVEAEDLALLRIVDADKRFPTVQLGTSSDLMVGERVLAIGNPYGQTFTVSAGIISGLHRNIDAAGGSIPLRFKNLIQTDASINPGNSGGPLLNINGELIGINTAVNMSAENIGFAIPVDRVWQVLQDQLLSRAQWNSWLGFELDEQDFLISKVVAGGPADLAGLQVGDRLVELSGTPLQDAEDYRFSRLAVQPHESTQFIVERARSRVPITLSGWDRANGILYERLGLTLKSVTFGRLRPVRLVQVESVREGGPAARIGIQPNDVLEAAKAENGARAQLLADPGHLALLAVGLEKGNTIQIDIWRDDNGDGRFERNEQVSELYKGTLTLE